MKFLAFALATVLGAASAKKSFTGKDLNARIRNGQINKKTLMSKARPYGNNARKLEEDEEFEITNQYSVEFDSCVSLKIQDDEMLEEDWIDYAAEGSIVAEKSYILFTVCLTEECYYDADDSKMTFITDVATFVQALVEYLPNQREEYCNACEQNEDYCMGNYEVEEEEEAEEEEGEEEEEEGEEEGEEEEGEEEEEEGEEEGEEEEGEEGEEEGEEGEEGEGEEGEDRKLKSKKSRRKLAKNVQYIDCDQCETYQCFQGDDDQNQNDAGYEDALEWIQQISECNQIENAEWNNAELYAGLICNSDNSGVEIGVFLDEDCTIYTNQASFAYYMNNNDDDEVDQYNNYKKSAELIEHMFTNEFSCYNEEIEYVNPYDYEGEDEAEEDEEENYEAAEWCQGLFQGDFQARSLYDCGGEEEEEEEEQDDDANQNNYEWYVYDLSEDDVNDEYKVCSAVQEMEGEYTALYDQESSGTLFNYNKKNRSNKNNGGLSPGAIVGIVIALIIAAAIGAAWACQGKSKSSDRKKTPLINGSMA